MRQLKCPLWLYSIIIKPQLHFNTGLETQRHNSQLHCLWWIGQGWGNWSARHQSTHKPVQHKCRMWLFNMQSAGQGRPVCLQLHNHEREVSKIVIEQISVSVYHRHLKASLDYVSVCDAGESKHTHTQTHKVFFHLVIVNLYSEPCGILNYYHCCWCLYSIQGRTPEGSVCTLISVLFKLDNGQGHQVS